MIHHPRTLALHVCHLCENEHWQWFSNHRYGHWRVLVRLIQISLNKGKFFFKKNTLFSLIFICANFLFVFSREDVSLLLQMSRDLYATAGPLTSGSFDLSWHSFIVKQSVSWYPMFWCLMCNNLSCHTETQSAHVLIQIFVQLFGL